MSRKWGWVAVLMAGTLAARVAAGGLPGTPPAPRVESLGSVQVDLANHVVIARGYVNQQSGLVELLACGPEGKTHESIFILQVDAQDLQAALLLLGLRPGSPPDPAVRRPPAGTGVRIEAAWESGGASRRVRAEQTVKNRKTGEALPETTWTFSGSETVEGRFMASLNQSLVATYWDGWAILNLPLPEGADDEILYANESVLPTNGTPVTLFFSPEKRVTDP